MKFVANLRDETIAAFGAEDIQPAAYLLSSHRVTRATLRAAAHVRAIALPLFADNGTKPLIEATIALFEKDTAEWRSSIKDLRRTLGRAPRPGEIPAGLREQARAAAKSVVAHAVKVSTSISTDDLIDAQISMHPTDVIAQEDFATACLIALDLEREFTGWTIGQFNARNRRSLKLWRQVRSDPRLDGRHVYAVLSAMDYNTARSAGQLAAEHGANNAALGIAGITLDPSATDFFALGSSFIELDAPAPRRYVRLAQILKGLADGYADTGVPLARFHCLGLGAPAMLPIVAAALSERTTVTLDATSPIHDAVRDRVMYDAAEEGDRASLTEIVQRILHGTDWRSASPFAIAFQDQYGHDPEAARSAWHQLGKPKITPALLRQASDLTRALPLFSDADPAVRKLASKVRIAHNHWVLGTICESFADRRGRHKRAYKAIDRWVARATSLSTTRGLAAARRVLLHSS